MLQVILGSFGVFPRFKNLVSRKRQVLEWQKHLDLYIIQFYVVIVFHLVKQSAKPLGFLFVTYLPVTINNSDGSFLQMIQWYMYTVMEMTTVKLYIMTP